MNNEEEKRFGISIGNIKSNQTNIGEKVTATQNNYYGKNQNFENDLVFHVIGEQQFGQSDAIALDQGGVKTVVSQAYEAPYFITFVDELERQREDNKVMKLIHFSGHGDIKKGILFGKQWVDWKLFNETITAYDDIEILFIAACSSIEVADHVSGKINWVLACAIDVPDNDAIKATETFWTYVTKGKSPEEAFEAVKLNVPAFAPHFRLRGVG